ncbi:MAG: hypothetical protein HY738_15850 [Bacteroidia bacterium]|nr:hypothetical protein [Bacteroidia bacterium]
MSKIQDLLKDKNDQIDFIELIRRYNWIIQRDFNCILSPDSDGFLCGLFMSHYFNWKISGYYDGKVLLINKNVSAFDKNCAFLDIEIFRKAVKSIGHHMLKYNNRLKHDNFDQFENTIQPNLLRSYDGKNHFRLKYPLATIHFLIAIAAQTTKIDIPDSAIAPLFFVDGTFQVLYSYPENVLNWLKYLKIDELNSPLRKIFMNEKQTVHSQMLLMDNFFRQRDEISEKNERGDRLRISTKQGDYFNIEKQSINNFRIEDSAKKRVIRFIKLLSETTCWKFKEENWCFENLNIAKFSKRDFTSQKLKLNNKTFENMIVQNPLSWAMTSGTNVEYTLEQPDKLK